MVILCLTIKHRAINARPQFTFSFLIQSRILAQGVTPPMVDRSSHLKSSRWRKNKTESVIDSQAVSSVRMRCSHNATRRLSRIGALLTTERDACPEKPWRGCTSHFINRMTSFYI